MPIRATSSNSVAQDVKRGELIQAVISARPASNLLVSPTGIFMFLNRNPMRPGYTALFKTIENADSFGAAV